MKVFKNVIAKVLRRVSFSPRCKRMAFKLLGIHFLDIGGKKARMSSGTKLIGNYDNVFLHENAEINHGCFLLAKDRIEVGVNSTLAYGVSILTSANPHGPYNLLSKLYPRKIAPVIIGDNVWIGANATILPGVKIGDCSVVAAGALVNKDVPNNVVVAGVPAKIVKRLPELME